jgi:glycosyltransferase involved in cell wall biosynthesis
MTEVFFSIVIPTYNRAHLILKTLNSVLNQTYTNYEIIVVDNASTDNTLEILSDLEKDGQIIIIRNKINQERSISRNLGMEKAKGDFLTFLDSDDIMYPNNLSDAIEFLNNNPQYNFFHNLYNLTDENDHLIHKYKFPSLKNLHFRISHGNFLSCIGVFISKKIYSSYKFDVDENLLGVEDWEYWLRIAADFPLGRITNRNNAIIQHNSRTVNNISVEDVLKKQMLVVEKVKQNPITNKCYSPFLKRMKASGYLYASIIANSNKNYKLAGKMLIKCISIDINIIFTFRFNTVLRIRLFGF